jgi:hypothetical protein
VVKSDSFVIPDIALRPDPPWRAVGRSYSARRLRSRKGGSHFNNAQFDAEATLPLGRRTKGRTAINHGAVVLVEGDTGVHSCPVCNVTNDGACIQLSGLNIVPPLFDLSFDNFRTTRRCRLIWRNRDLVGVAFES